AVARGQHQDRGGGGARAEGAADREPVLPRQEPVEDDQVVLVHRGLLLAVLAGGGNVDDEALLLKSLGQEPGGFPVVLDQQESHRGLILARGRGRGATGRKIQAPCRGSSAAITYTQAVTVRLGQILPGLTRLMT